MAVQPGRSLKLNLSANLRQVAITAALFVLILILLVVFVDLEEVVHQVRQADWRYLVWGLFFYLAGLTVFALRWRLLLNGQAPIWSVFHAANAGHLLSLFLPLRAGEPARIMLVSRWSSLGLPVIVSSVVVERLLEQVLRLAALGGAAVFGLGIPVSVQSILGALIFLAAAFGLLFWMAGHREIVVQHWPLALARLPWVREERARRLFSGMIDGLWPLASPRRAVTALLLSSLTWTLFWGMHYLVLFSLGSAHSASENLAISLGSLGLAPPSAATLPGIYHASIVAPLTALGFDGTFITAYAVILHLIQMLILPLMGLWAFFRSTTISPIRESEISDVELGPGS